METKFEYVERKRTKFLALPLYFTKYSIGAEKINIRHGFLNITEDDTYMYKVQDVRLNCSFMARLFGLGTVVCFTGDTTDPKLEIKNIRHAKEIKEYILTASEEARLRRRTRYNLEVGSGYDDDDADDHADAADEDEH